MGTYILTHDPSNLKSYHHTVSHITAANVKVNLQKQDPKLNLRICLQ
jgi:hypothetical protein